MRTRIRPFLILVALGLMAQPLTAQVDLTDDRTADQMWARSVFMLTFAQTSMISYASEAGQTAEEFAKWWVEIVGPTWGEPGSRTLAAFVTSMFRNYRLWDGLEFEVLAESETEIRGRMNTPYASYFGETGERYGATLEDYRTLSLAIYEGTADYLGFDMTHEVDGDWIEFTVTTR